MPFEPESVDRRQILRGASALGLGAVGLAALPATTEAALVAGSCTLTPSQVTGPYYRDLNLVRKDVTEGMPGLPLRLFLRIQDIDGCVPLQGAEVEIWHTSARGRYSDFASQGTAGLTWMRGVQFTDANGFVRFVTLYPGWYATRTTHIHVKVYPQTGWELTTQVYFNDLLTSQVYTQPPYDVRGQKDTSNAADQYYRPELELRTKLVADPTQGDVMIMAGQTIIVDQP